MAFAKATGSQRQSEWGHVVWAKKDPEIVTPNIEFYDRETNTRHYLIGPGETGTVQIDGVIKRVSAYTREGYNDRQKNEREGRTGDNRLQNEWRLMIVFDDGGDKDHCVTFDMIFDTGVPDTRTMQVINTLHQHLVVNGDKDEPVLMSLYKNKKGYPASSFIRSSGVDEEGRPVFDDFEANMIRTAELPPRGTPIMQGDTQLEVNGIKAFDWTNVKAWAEEKMSEILDCFPRQEQIDDEGVNPAEGLDEDGEDEGQDASRPRQSA